jgi:hypothetical protein
MSDKKILHAAMNAFKQKFSEFCQNEPDCLDPKPNQSEPGAVPKGMRTHRGLSDASKDKAMKKILPINILTSICVVRLCDSALPLHGRGSSVFFLPPLLPEVSSLYFNVMYA